MEFPGSRNSQEPGHCTGSEAGKTSKRHKRSSLALAGGSKKHSKSIDTFEPSLLDLGTSKSADDIPAADAKFD